MTAMPDTSIEPFAIDLLTLDDIVTEIASKYGKSDLVDHKVAVVCPKCERSGFVTFCKDVLSSSKDNVYDYPVPAGTICEHAFIVQIDANLKSR